VLTLVVQAFCKHMYSQKELQGKSLLELKEIGWQMRALPEGDRRLRRNWIRAIKAAEQAADVNDEVNEPGASQEPLKQVAENSPGLEVEPAQEAIAPATKNFLLDAEVDPVQEPISQALKNENSPGVDCVYCHSPEYESLRDESYRCYRCQPDETDLNPILTGDSFSDRSLTVGNQPKIGQRAIAPFSAKNSPGVEVDPVTGPIAPVAENSLGVKVDLAQRIEEYLDISELWELDRADCPACGGIDSLHARWSQEYAYGYWIINCQECDSSCTCSIEDLPPCLQDDDDDDDDEDADSENSPGVDRSQEPIENSPGVEVQAQEPIAQAIEISPGVEVDPVTGPIAQAAKNPPGSCSKSSTAHQLLELFNSRAHVIEDSPGVKTEATVSESARGLLAKNPILTGIALSDKFCARYSPPQSEIRHYEIDTEGQLSLLDFEVEPLAAEPPDPDDFESREAFDEAMARWEGEHYEEPAGENSPDVGVDSVQEPQAPIAPATKNSPGVKNELLQTQNDAPTGTVTGASATPVPPGCDLRPEHNGASCHRQDERLAGQKGDRLLEEKGSDSGDTRRVLPHQPAQLAPQAINIAPHLKPGVTVGHKSGAYLGEIEKIYYSQKRRKWRAKIGPANYDLDNLLEQKVIPWDFPEPMGWKKTRSMMCRHDACNIWNRNRPRPTPQALDRHWTVDELTALPIWQLKAIALGLTKEIPGGYPRTKAKYIRTIIAEQVIQGRSDEQAKPAPVETAKPAAKPTPYWLNQKHSEQAAALGALGWTFLKAESGKDFDLDLITTAGAWKFYGCQGEPLLAAICDRAMFILDCTNEGDWMILIKRAKEALKEVFSKADTSPIQLSLNLFPVAS